MSDLIHFCHCLFGMPRSGKTVLIKYLIASVFNDFSTAYLFSNTCFTNQWEYIIPPQNIYPDYNEQALNNIVSLSQRISKRGGSPPNILLIFDDCICSFKKKEFLILKEIILHRRHLRISIILSTQYIKDNAPWLRNSTDFIYIFPQKTKSGIDACHDSISGVMDKDKFKSLITKCPEHVFLAVDYQNSEFNIMKVELPIPCRQFRIITCYKIEK